MTPSSIVAMMRAMPFFKIVPVAAGGGVSGELKLQSKYHAHRITIIIIETAESAISKRRFMW